MRPHGRARISASKPEAQAVCDRCGFRYPHSALAWQFDWEGARLQNLRILVCQGCYDKPQENVRTIILPPDPMPIANPRPEWFVSDNNPISGLGWDPARLFQLPQGSSLSVSNAFSGSMTGGGGLDAPFFGGPKTFVQSATVPKSASSVIANNIIINWSACPNPGPAIPAGFGIVTQSYAIASATVTAPIDAAFLGTNIGTTVTLWGSSNGSGFSSLASSTSLGLKGESVTITSTNQTPYAYHMISVQGDNVHSVAVAQIQMSAIGPSAAQQGSELGA